MTHSEQQQARTCARLEIGLAYQLLRIRLFEQRALEAFSKGKFFGTTHTCIGQEADAVGVISALHESDIVFSNHRCHGHYLAYGGDMRALAAELMGRETGVCGGVGGSQHLHFKNFYSNGIQGGIVPCATGIALAEKRKRSGSIVAVFLGDGTLGEGVVYESLNIASLWKLPVLFVLENNRYAQTTPIKMGVAGEISSRFKAFNIETVEIDTTDVLEIQATAVGLISSVRDATEPRALIINTYRLAPHSKGDDYRDPTEIEQFRRLDPVTLIRNRLNEDEWAMVYAAAETDVNSAYRLAESDPLPQIPLSYEVSWLSELYDHST
jgi:TPP-dependent pyruvate/acetoin dehydrogenase alpha subunit